MPISITWDDEAKTTIICKIEGDFSLPTDMTDSFKQVDTFAKTVEHEVGVIMDWTQFQPLIPDSSLPELRTEGRRGILRGDFGSSGSVIHSTNSNWTAPVMKDNPQPSKIAITAFVFPDTIATAMKPALSQMLNITKNQGRFVIASSMDAAREIIGNHFQQGDTGQNP